MVQNLEDSFQEMMFHLDLIEHLREISFEGHLYQEENMMSCDPFEDLDDTLFHDFGSEEVSEDPLDATNPFGKGKIKCSVLRIKPLVIKRQWRSMPIKRKKNYDEVQHVDNSHEASLSFLMFDEVEVV
jgi:hypothetical protein